MKTTVTSIDFGTSKIVALVAENSTSTRCDIVGAGIVTYNGFLEDGWNAPEEIDSCLREAIMQAETQSHRKIREVNIGVPGAFTKVYVTEARVSLTGPDPHVTPADVRAIFTEAQKKKEAVNAQYDELLKSIKERVEAAKNAKDLGKLLAEFTKKDFGHIFDSRLVSARLLQNKAKELGFRWSKVDNAFVKDETEV